MSEILVVDDEPSIRLAVGDALRDAGHRVDVASDGAAAIAKLDSKTYDVVITDIRLPKADGMTVFRHVRSVAPETDVILFTAFGAIADAVTALKEGAYDYLTKPVLSDELIVRVARSAERRSVRRQLDAARRELAEVRGANPIIGRSPPMVRLTSHIETMAPSDAPVLILGESGTGKELVARRLHDLSPRRDKPFIAVNCAALPETLLEAELFGHERGAFTGATSRRSGRFKAAHGGTLFLDEVAEMPPSAQAKLLRVLQEGTIEPLGSDTPIKVDVRVISATHQKLRDRIAQKLFREDLYYRLKVLDLSIPPLRERRSDLPLFVEHFLAELAGPNGKLPAISPQAWAALSEHPFPGNVRELRHAIERAYVLCRGETIELDHLPEDIALGAHSRPASTAAPVREPGALRPLGVALKEFEKEYLGRALTEAGGRKLKAAEALGISRKNLWEKLRAYGLSTGQEPADEG